MGKISRIQSGLHHRQTGGRLRRKGREEATGRGVGILSFKMLKRLGRRPKDTRVVIQGFGNVGSHAAKFMHESEFKILGNQRCQRWLLRSGRTRYSRGTALHDREQ